METEIKSLKARINVLLIIGGISCFFSILRFFFPLGPIGQSPAAVPAHQTQSVKIGEATTAPSEHAEYLTVSQVAKELNLAERTVLTAIAEDRIFPAPTKLGNRAWSISKDYRYQPPSTADSR